MQTYNCNSCAYSVMMGGGRQNGMGNVEWTIACRDCLELIDVRVSEEAWNTPDSWIPEGYSCPFSKAHRVELWSESSGCPKCSGAMIVDEAADSFLWD